MSKSAKTQIECTNCHNPFEVIYWKSLNTQLNPALKANLLDESIFNFKCPKCDSVSKIEYDILYHDPDQKIMIWLLHPDKSGELSFNPSTNSLTGRATVNYKLRIVNSGNELTEKIRIFDSGLDDKAVEASKYPIFIDYLIRDKNAPALILFQELVSDLDPPELAYRVIRTGDEDAYLEPWSDYTVSIAMIKNNPSPISIYGDWEVVNREYVLEMGKLMKQGKEIQHKQNLLIEHFIRNGNASVAALIKAAKIFEYHDGAIAIGFASDVLKEKAEKFTENIRMGWERLFKELISVDVFLAEKNKTKN